MSIKDEFKKGMACDSVGKPDSVIGRAICIGVHPGKMVLAPFLIWFERRYKGKYKFARIMFTIDLVLIGILIGLLIAIVIGFIPKKQFVDDISLSATVAPREIVAGAPSTLVIRYVNGTEETLEQAELSFTYPDHFLLQDIISPDEDVQDNVIELGDIPIGGSASIKIKGVMFGDVGGEQRFGSSMTFVHGEEKIAEQKVDEYTFSPVKSTLALNLTLPEKLLSFQEIEGVIDYENTGEIDFPNIRIQPEWPAGFTLSYAEAYLIEGAFEVPAIEAGKTGSVSFTGYLGDVGEQTSWTFHPSFTFGSDQYRQETLYHTADVVPPPIRTTHSVSKATLTPGSEATFTIGYENISDYSVSDFAVGVESQSPFFAKGEYLHTYLVEEIKPGESGVVIVAVPLRSSIRQSETDVYEDLVLDSRSVAHYTLGDGSGQQVTSKGDVVESPLSTPLVLETFGRYRTVAGDQIGRGPNPPRPGRETTYWVFWHIDGTTNTIENVSIQGTLPEGVRFTGRQTVSQGDGVVYDDNARTVTWSGAQLNPTLSPTSKVLGVAFEVGITPNGKDFTLMENVSLSAVDSKTGQILNRFVSSIEPISE